MVDIISKQELPVIITKVKIGNKDLTDKLIKQIPFDYFVSHTNKDGKKKYGLPIKPQIKLFLWQ